MKRSFVNYSNLEPAIKCNPVVDFNTDLQVKKMKFDRHGAPLHKVESLPTNMFHLGGENYVTVDFFLEHTRVHIRRYVTDNDGFLHATKDGVSLHPSVWNSFQKKVDEDFDFDENILVVDKDLCVFFEKNNDLECYVFQRMFQRKNLKLEFLHESVKLSPNHLSNLVDFLPDINAKVKEILIRKTLSHFVLRESKSQSISANDLDNDNFFNSEMANFTELTDSLSECLTNAISLKISEFLNCFACENDLPKSYPHNCALTSREEKYINCFDVVFYKLDWRHIAKDFYCKNSNKFLMGISEFFCCLDVDTLFRNVKNLYVKDEEDVYNDLTISLK